MYTIAAFYQFARFEDPKALQGPLAKLACGQGVTGTLLLANEGVNGTIAGSATGVEAVVSHIRSLPGCAGIEPKYSQSHKAPFRRLKVRLKREIVTMGQPDVDPSAAVGHYVDPADWNDLIGVPDVAVIDTRNDYEVKIGTFSGAIDPKTEKFGDFPAWWNANKAALAGKRIAMFCTGGIRCEKATNYLIGEGVEDVFHLKGGILKYLEDVPKEASTWEGECFVFDELVSVGHGLKAGDYQLCRGCRRPLSPDDLKRPEYEAGVACHHCVDETTDAQKARFRERQRQCDIARTRDRRKSRTT